MKKLLLIAYFFPPMGGAGVQRALKIANYLPAFGWQPIVVAGPRVPPSDRWSPTDHSLAEELDERVAVEHVEASPDELSRNASFQRLNRWLGLPSVFSRWWRRVATRRCSEVLRNTPVDLVLATMSPFESAKVACRAAELAKVPWVADLRDPWALDEMAVYPTALHRRIEIRRMLTTLSRSSLTIVNTREAASRLRAEAESKGLSINMDVVTNGFDLRDFDASIPERSDGKFRIVHTGYLHTEMGERYDSKRIYRRWLGGICSGVEFLTRSHVYLMRALHELKRNHPKLADCVEVHLVGRLSKGDMRIVEESGLQDQVFCPGYLSHSEAVAYMRSADLLFLPMHNLSQGQRATIIPGKTFEYIASGCPILGAVPDGDARDLLTGMDRAFVTRPDDVQGMAAILLQRIEAWQAAGRRPEARPVPPDVLQYERQEQVERIACRLNDISTSRPI
ncbi:MAG: glycosyltransferase [Acidobacteriota bacterium]